ncbi:MAG: hypothetical protein JSW25_03515, partial [Thermoplasmata archaeon]
KGLYYYLWTQTRALAISGQDWVVDGSGKLHDWRSDMANLFMDLQQPNGQFPGNPQVGWREEEPEIAGIYSIIAMQAAYMTAPNPELEIAIDGGSARFIDLEGNVLVSDPVKGLTVSDRKLTCTDPETFRKLWVDVTEGSGSLTASGTWSGSRVSTSSTELASGDSHVLVTTGGFTGPFGVHVKNYGSDSPDIEVDKREVELVRGETAIIDFELTETSGNGPVTRVMMITNAGEGVIADVEEQGIDVASGDVNVIRLTISVDEGVKKGGDSHLLLTSLNAPPIVIPIEVVDAEDQGAAIGLWYWMVVILLVVLVFFFILLPRVARRNEEAAETTETEPGPTSEPEPAPVPEPEPEPSGEEGD